ncbi:MAG: tetratricopeptide repeat protein [Rhodospirillales bacterium]|nr:tetratricopeptide repeat protein [Rhodospirillales bacterium]
MPFAAEPQARYRECLAQIGIDPLAASNAANQWVKEGGGDAARHCRAMARQSAGLPRDAAEEFELLSANAPPQRKATLLAQAADAWVEAGAPDRALAVLTEALALQPNDPALLIQRAQTSVALGQLDAAVEDLNMAIDSDGFLMEAYVLRASALRRLDRLDRSALDLDTVLSLDRDNPDALLERGLLRQAAGDRENAREDWRRVVAVAPDSAAAAMATRHLEDAGE